jgi:hypothetical protein
VDPVTAPKSEGPGHWYRGQRRAARSWTRRDPGNPLEMSWDHLLDLEPSSMSTIWMKTLLSTLQYSHHSAFYFPNCRSLEELESRQILPDSKIYCCQISRTSSDIAKQSTGSALRQSNYLTPSNRSRGWTGKIIGNHFADSQVGSSGGLFSTDTHSFFPNHFPC